MTPEVGLVRRVAFSAGHRYWFADRSEAELRALFGPWASPYTHGHNYVLWVKATGSVDPKTGMVVNIKWIDDLLQQKVVKVFDQKSINDEVAWFANAAPTVENLLLYFSEVLSDLPGEAKLAGLKLEETPLIYGEWTPQTMLTLTRIYEFSACHRLDAPALTKEENLNLFGKCNNPHGHGHNYVLEVTVAGDPDPLSGMLCDISALDTVVNDRIVDRYDHRNLNVEVPELLGKIPTSEVVAQAIFDLLEPVVPATLHRIRLFETARNVFEVTRARA